MRGTSLLLLLVLSCFIAPIVKADLPVHCLATDIAGEWVFFMGPAGGDSSTPCGHGSPDENTDHIRQNINFPLAKTVKVSLVVPNVAQDDAGNMGSWTMVYDEGFEVVIDGQKFFAFSKYTTTTNQVPKDTDNEETAGYTSICAETFAGWFHNVDETDWGCWYGKKTDGTKNLKQEQQMPNAFVSLTNSYYDASPYEPDISFVEKINSIGNKAPWRARVHDHFKGKTQHQMNKMLGRSKWNKIHATFMEGDFDALNFVEKASSLLEIESKFLEREPSVYYVSRPTALPNDNDLHTTLPRFWDWRNVNGVNYDSPVRSQGECGSCYAIAAASVMESRIRIKSNNSYQPMLSAQGVLSCSRYNQGCNGGYPFLVGKHAKEFGFVEESCFPYHERDTDCSAGCMNPPRVWKAGRYQYVGKGYYGGCSENEMMKEIYTNGPVVVALDAQSDLYYYSHGIFTTKPAKHQEVASQAGVNPWESTNHAVVCVGWGEEAASNGEIMKYWIIKNSWGPQWGDNGYFKIRKGADEGGVESQAVAFDPSF
eukprot:GILJ01000804.1.p1 GENE.GILJ01000804.1~~GILJ01000804.1.p1  ORF type:complete len:559 (+),score=64.67 GILJ01000804.1:63-1679(+)